jgi:hypothetical protein
MKNLLILVILCFSISQLIAQKMSSVPLVKLEILHSEVAYFVSSFHFRNRRLSG